MALAAGAAVNASPVHLDNTRRNVAVEIHRVMMAAYQVEAGLLGVPDFFPLRRTVEQILSAASLFFGAFSEDRLAAVAEVEAEAEPVNPMITLLRP